MPTMWPPSAACQRDSARVENRGPLITTSVPPSAGQPRPVAAASAAARPRGSTGRRTRRAPPARRRRRRCAPGPTCGPRPGPARPGCPGPSSGSIEPDRARREHLPDAERAQRPEVRPVVHPVRREAVVPAVPGDEGDGAAGHLADERNLTGRSERGVDGSRASRTPSRTRSRSRSRRGRRSRRARRGPARDRGGRRSSRRTTLNDGGPVVPCTTGPLWTTGRPGGAVDDPQAAGAEDVDSAEPPDEEELDELAGSRTGVDDGFEERLGDVSAGLDAVLARRRCPTPPASGCRSGRSRSP